MCGEDWLRSPAAYCQLPWRWEVIYPDVLALYHRRLLIVEKQISLTSLLAVWTLEE